MHPTDKTEVPNICVLVNPEVSKIWSIFDQLQKVKALAGFQKRNPSRGFGPWPLDLGHDYLVKCRLWGFAPKLPSFNCLTQDRALLLRWVMAVSLSSSRHPAQLLPLCLSSPSFHSLLPRNQWYLIDDRLNHNETLPKALRTQALTALTSNFGLVGLVQYAW